MFQHLVVFVNPLTQLVDHLQQRSRGRTRLLRQVQVCLLSKLSAGALRHPRSEAFHQAAHSVDELRARFHQQIPCPHQVQIPLRFRAPMPHRLKQLRLGPGHLGQRARVLRITLLCAGGEQA